MSPHEVNGTVPENSTTFRTQADEHADHEASLQSLRTGKYEDWPNEAAFDGLTEERGPIKIAVTGNIPTWAAGSLYRTGPGLYKIDTDAGATFEMSHWFDGLAHTHRFDIIPNEEGSVDVFYSSRRQAEEMMEVIKKQGTWPYYSFGQKADPCLGLFSKAMAAFKGLRESPEEKWHNNINVVVHVNPPGLEAAAGNIVGKGKLAVTENDPQVLGHRPELPKSIWISTDNCAMKQIDPKTLEPIGWATQDVLHPELKGPMSCAHAQRDPETGDLFNYNLELGPKPTYRIFRVDASSGKTEILATIRDPIVSPAYIHSLFLSPSFVVLCIPTSHFGLNGTQIPWERNLLDAIRPYDPSRKTQWIVIDRKHGKGVVARFETDGRFFFHTVNAFEEPSSQPDSSEISLYCDVIDFGSHEFIHSLYLDVILDRDSAAKKFYEDEQRARNSLAHLTRYHFTINPDSPSNKLPTTPDPKNHEAFRIPAPHAGELPTINPLYATKKHRYVYSLPFRGRSTLTDAIVKTDTDTREVLFWDNPKGHIPGEAIFIPRPVGEEEDDGVLLSLVLDGEKGKSYLLCLDAKTMTEMGRAEVEFAIALGFHGAHVPSSRTVTRVEGQE
ncbi:carotenoid oxygenase [Neurospora tetraspora]|uniref:Carotenoid oxygenase n=1 Tax=Neurospora tetraspora TaxID=94610 RepID=A0AAE0JGA3_9PEZI|nr:carotenoid oxygenase [Neurospora tetraspora]